MPGIDNRVRKITRFKVPDQFSLKFKNMPYRNPALSIEPSDHYLINIFWCILPVNHFCRIIVFVDSIGWKGGEAHNPLLLVSLSGMPLSIFQNIYFQERYRKSAKPLRSMSSLTIFPSPFKNKAHQPSKFILIC